ncbi:MAG: hypothetical protein HOM55_03345 [Proteobacteria bacterium]|jgi:hypothetical protein|nr:hypothetical protein [Pseudomonadota bacterium]
MYTKKYPSDEWSAVITEIFFDESAVEILKLSNWIEETQEFVIEQKQILDAKKTKEDAENDLKEAKEIDDNFDLGDYE